MLGSVQRFPEERILLVETSRAACVLVVWAHHVLGLSVLVRNKSSTGKTSTPFGEPPHNVIVDVAVHIEDDDVSVETGYTRRRDAATLLSTDGSKLFKLEADPDDNYLECTFRGPAGGFGQRMIESELRRFPNSGVLVKETMLLAVAFSLKFSETSRIVKSATKQESVAFPTGWEQGEATIVGLRLSELMAESQRQGDDDLELMSYSISKTRLYEAAKFLFMDTKLAFNKAEEYSSILCGDSLQTIEVPLGTISTIMGKLQDKKLATSLWTAIRRLAVTMSTLLYAFAHVPNLAACNDLPVIENMTVLNESAAFKRIASWKTDTHFESCEDDSFQLIGRLMLGTSPDIDMSAASLVSRAGWSMFLSTITENDPSLIRELCHSLNPSMYVIQATYRCIRLEKGCVCIKRGVPVRNKVYKHFILDAPLINSDYLVWNTRARSGDEITLNCADTVQVVDPYCEEQGDSFLVSLRIVHEAKGPRNTKVRLIRRTGFRERFDALWNAQLTKGCPDLDGGPQSVVLPSGCVALAGFGDHGGFGDTAEVYICQTANNQYARWRALLSISSFDQDEVPYHPVLLRSADTCLKCALDEALTYHLSPCFLIL